ncbi:MAG: hypothetical protein N2036_12055 [Bryobacteraceae bacterium]|nr:hypothetical protein [Bryobacteraceae bacterium]
MADHRISIDSSGNPQPATLNCKAGDRITWTNNLSVALNGFTLPSCVSPQQSPAPLAAGATTRAFTVNQGAKGKFQYSYAWPRLAQDARGGTIDVS